LEEVARLVGSKVAVRLKNAETHGVEIVATLEEVRDAGVTLSGIGELGPGPTLFCPWESLERVRDRPPWLTSPHEGSGSYSAEQQYSAEYDPEEFALPRERRPNPSASTLERVVSIARQATVGGITVALTSLEFFERGPGVLRWRVSLFEGASGYEDEHRGIAHPVFEIRDGSGRILSWSPLGSSSGDGEADGEIEVEGLPDAGEISVEIPRITSESWREELAEKTYDGPWSFSFSI